MDPHQSVRLARSGSWHCLLHGAWVRLVSLAMGMGSCSPSGPCHWLEEPRAWLLPADTVGIRGCPWVWSSASAGALQALLLVPPRHLYHGFVSHSDFIWRERADPQSCQWGFCHCIPQLVPLAGEPGQRVQGTGGAFTWGWSVLGRACSYRAAGAGPGGRWGPGRGRARCFSRPKQQLLMSGPALRCARVTGPAVQTQGAAAAVVQAYRSRREVPMERGGC